MQFPRCGVSTSTADNGTIYGFWLLLQVMQKRVKHNLVLRVRNVLLCFRQFFHKKMFMKGTQFTFQKNQSSFIWKYWTSASN